MRHAWGWGIVNKLGEPYWEEACVCEDRGPLDDILKDLNDPINRDAASPYRVVRLYFHGKKLPKRASQQHKGTL